jgi:hypothetical protein
MVYYKYKGKQNKQPQKRSGKMKTVKLIVSRTSGIEKHIVRVPENRSVVNYTTTYLSALRAAYGDVLCGTFCRGYVWRGNTGDLDDSTLDRWTDARHPEYDVDTWDTI